MKSNPGRILWFIAILFLLAFVPAAKTNAQGAPPQPPPPIPTQSSLTALPATPGPAIGEEFTELSAGIFTYSKTDLSLPGPMPINVTRVYRSTDQTSTAWNNRAFGVGTRLNYDIFIYQSYHGGPEFVSMPDSSTLTCSTTSGGPPYTCNSQPSGVWFGSVLDSNDDLTRPDGTVYSFNSTTGLLMSITDRYGNSITITRGNGSIQENDACYTGSNGLQVVPTNYVEEVSSSNGRAVYFCYDNLSYPDDITAIADNAAGGPIKEVTYTYGAGSVLATVTQGNSSNAKTTYQYNQTSPSGVGNITTIIQNDSCPNGGCGTPNKVYTYITYYSNNLGTSLASISSQLPGNGYSYNDNDPSGYPASHVTVTLPDSASRDFYFDSNGYLIEDAREVGSSSVNPEYTFFNRGQQTVGTSTEFVGEVQEENQNNAVVRQTTYNYDTSAGNVLSVNLCPAPGQTATFCAHGTPTATWNYTYTTYNRLASAVEPLAYNGVGTTYTYVDGSSPSMTVTDPLDRVTTVDYNEQGQPISAQDPMDNTPTKIQYYSPSGDVESVTDPIGNTTSYVTDADGRVKSVTSPKQETTHYTYDAIDDVTEVIDPIGNITCNTYDLIGELSTTTPPKGVSGSCSNIVSGFTTTIGRSPNLTKTTLTDPLGNTTVTDLDGQGRSTDYTDKRGVETTYTYDKLGRLTTAFFNENNKSAYSQEKVEPSNYDALDRPGQVYDSLLGNTDTFTYDSLNSILSTSDSLYSYHSVSYTYDSNGRRIGMQTNAQAFSYGHDCADELVGISGNGTWTPPNCGPSTFVNYTGNVSSSAQVAFNLDADGNPVETLVDGVETVMTRDADERVTGQTFGAYASPAPTPSYGGLTYQYDADSHVIDKGGSLAVVNIPSAVSTAVYSATDQVTNWNGTTTAPDNASNIITDPANGLALTWTARNQMATATGASEAYDGLGRRETSTGGGSTLNFDYDGSAMIGWAIPYSSSYNFLTLPGGGALAGTYTTTVSSTTWVPLIDASGSTIGLVNAASTQSPPATTYTYDPSGNPTVSGTANDWPFQYKGMEKEFTDPGTYYYSGGGQFYSPQLVRSLSETTATSSSGTGGPPPRQVPYGPGSHGNGSFGHWLANQELGSLGVGIGSGASGFGNSDPSGGNIDVLPIIGIAEFWASFFDWLFGGSGAPPTPRQLLHGRHPLYDWILQIVAGLLPDEKSAANMPSGPGSSPPNFSPLLKVQDVIVPPESTVPAQPQALPWGLPGDDLPQLPFSAEPKLTPSQYQECLNAANATQGDWDAFCGTLPTNRMRGVCRSANFQSTEYKEGICDFLKGFVAGPMA